MSACKGQSNTSYPYGATYMAGMCNGDSVAAQVEPTGRNSCRSEWDGRGGNSDVGWIYDMSGNAWEWVAPLSGSPSERWIVGGCFDSSPEDLDCGTMLQVDGNGSSAIGFRCCSRVP